MDQQYQKPIQEMQMNSACGILIYHDVCAFPNLAEIVDRCRE